MATTCHGGDKSCVLELFDRKWSNKEDFPFVCFSFEPFAHSAVFVSGQVSTFSPVLLEIRRSVGHPDIRGKLFSPSRHPVCVHLKSLSGFYDNSALEISQRLWSDRCAFRTDRRKTREPLSGLSNIVVEVEYVFLCTFLFVPQIWNWLFPPQKHWNKGKPEDCVEIAGKKWTGVVPTLSFSSSAACDVRTRPSDHGGVQTGSGQTSFLCTGGI